MWTKSALISIDMDGAMKSNYGVKFTVCERVMTLGRDDHLLPAPLVLVLAIRDLLWPVLGKRIILWRIIHKDHTYVRSSESTFCSGLGV